MISNPQGRLADLRHLLRLADLCHLLRLADLRHQLMIIIQFKVQISKFKVAKRIIRNRQRCRRNCRNWWNC